MAKMIGIDLGTTNSCVAVVEGGKPVVIPNAEGQRTTPSVVAFTKAGERLVGEPAKRQAVTNAPRTVTSVKRLMGSDTRVPIDGKCYTPQELSALILQKLKADAEAYLGEPVTEAVITVPAYFNDAQRQATKDAGRIAGLDVRRIINEPTAAALAYGLDNGRTQTVMVYDLGGGTFDVSLIRIGDGIVQVLSTCGDNFLGGDDFDERIVNWLADQCRANHGVDLTNDRVAMQRLREEAEKAKKELSSAKQTDINLPFLTTAADGALHLQTTLTRAKFEELCADLIERTALPVRNALSDARLSASDLDQVLLVGGSTRIPAVQAKVVRMTGLEPSKSLNPDECVALGAAVQGGRLGGEMLSGPGEGLLLMDVTPLTLSIETVGGVATHLIERNSTIPTRFSKVFTTAAPFQNTVQIKVLQGEREFARDNKLLVAGASAYPRAIDFEKLAEIAHGYGAMLMVDMAHIAGLVAGGQHQSPVPYADVVTTTTHKTLRGPRGGLILTNNEYIIKRINSAIFPGTQGGPLEHVIAAKAVCFGEALKPEFKEYARKIVENAKALEAELTARGVKLVSGGTDNHLLLIDLTDEDCTGKELEHNLDEVHITANKNTVPGEKRSPFVTSGVRIGTPAVTTRGMGPDEMKVIADCIADCVFDFANKKDEVAQKVEELTKKFPLYE